MRDWRFRALTVVMILASFAVLPYLRGDGNGYYAWVRSPVIDGDLNFEDEFRRGDLAFVPSVFDEQGSVRPEMWTGNGHIRNEWSAGASLVWLPFFLIGHGVAMLGRAMGLSWSTDGFSTPYLWFVAWGTALCATAGMLLTANLARRYFRPGPVILATIAIWLASSLPIYQYFLPFGPYGAAVLVSAGLLYFWLKRGWGWARWLPLGFLAGLLATVHPVAVAWLWLPVLSVLGLERGSPTSRVRGAGIGALGVVIGILPQSIGKAFVFGSPFDSGFHRDWSFLSPHIGRVLIGARHGLLSWTPVIVLALIGLAILWRRFDRLLGIGLTAVFLTMLYIVASYVTPELSSYGNRFFVLFTPGFLLGAAAIAEVVWSRRTFAIAAVAALIVWNVLFMFQWTWGLVPRRDAVDWPVMIRQQFTEAPRQMVRAIHLFVTDRSELIRLVQDKDLEELESPKT